MHVSRTTVVGVIRPTNGARRFSLATWLLVIGSCVFIGSLLMRHKGEASPPVASRAPRFGGWHGEWRQNGGEMAINFRDDGIATFSEDGIKLQRLRPSFQGYEVGFKGRVQGQTWNLRLILSDDSAQLTGTPVVERPRGPVVISPGSSSSRPPNRAEEKSVDFGTFRKGL
jgi:hypothetical protein